ncbi:MAG: tubulin-like doman-containing protein, partial [Chloroflexota bacterium]
MDEIYSAFQDALASIKLLPSGQGHHITDSVQVYVVAFLGGGTGSGIVADVGVILRDMLATELQGQRLLLFGILPSDRMPGAGSNEESWRKSNATAAVLEVIATGLAARGTPNGVYRKRLLNRVYTIPEGPIFNEVYLIGRTNLNDVDRVAYMAGLDLFQRITDASGVGDRERSQSPDFKDLKGVDDRELYTNFSTSCPIEVRFPALEVADTFASLAAGRLLQLPDFVGEVPPEPAPTIEEQEEWEQTWDTYARPSQGATDDSTLVAPLLSFQASQFIGASSTRRNILWSQLEEAIRRIPAQLDRTRQIILKQETDRLDTIPDAQEGDMSSFTARRLTHL